LSFLELTNHRLDTAIRHVFGKPGFPFALAFTGLSLASLVVSPGSAKAAVTFDYSENVVPSNPLPEGSQPYLTAIIQDINDNVGLQTGQVKITLTNNLAGTSSVTQLAFNIKPFGNPSSSGGSVVGPPQGTIPIPNSPPLDTSVSIDSNNIKVEGSTTVRGFDFEINMNTNVYRSGKTLSIIVTDITTPITANSFLSTNLDGIGEYYTLAKIQSIGETGQSTVIKGTPRPIPGPLPILGAGIAFAYSRRMRRRVSDKSIHSPINQSSYSFS